MCNECICGPSCTCGCNGDASKCTCEKKPVAEQAPAEEQPKEQAPAEEQPKEQAPAEEQPKEQAPVEEKKEETPQ